MGHAPLPLLSEQRYLPPGSAGGTDNQPATTTTPSKLGGLMNHG